MQTSSSSDMLPCSEISLELQNGLHRYGKMDGLYLEQINLCINIGSNIIRIKL